MIKEFSASIMQIGSIISETHELTLKQGEGLDLIDENISRTRDNVVKAEENVAVAEKYQKKSNKLVYIFTGVVVLVAVIIIVVVVVTKKG